MVMFYPAPKRSTHLFRALLRVINKRFKERALGRGVPGLNNANFYEIKMGLSNGEARKGAHFDRVEPNDHIGRRNPAFD